KHRPIGTKQHLVVDPQGNDFLDYFTCRIKAQSGLIPTDIQIDVGPESAHHYTLFHKADCAMRQNEIYRREQPRCRIEQKWAGDAEIQDRRGGANMDQHRYVMMRAEFVE